MAVNPRWFQWNESICERSGRGLDRSWISWVPWLERWCRYAYRRRHLWSHCQWKALQRSLSSGWRSSLSAWSTRRLPAAYCEHCQGGSRGIYERVTARIASYATIEKESLVLTARNAALLSHPKCLLFDGSNGTICLPRSCSSGHSPVINRKGSIDRSINHAMVMVVAYSNPTVVGCIRAVG